jgi:hypothetical protein
VERLLSYIDEHLSELTGDLLPSLLDVDAVYREVQGTLLAAGVHQALWHFTQYARTRDTQQLDAVWRAMQSLWPPERFYFSSVVRVVFGFEDLLAVRTVRQFTDPELFLDELRLMRVVAREALCALSDRIEGRYGQAPGFSDHRPDTTTQPIQPAVRALPTRAGQALELAPLGQDFSPVAAEVEARMPVSRPTLSLTGGEAVVRLGHDHFVCRQAELARLWERLAAVGSPGAAHHEVVGIKAPDGYGKTRLVQRFEEVIRTELGLSPLVLRGRAPRLFSLPLWPIAQLLRTYFEAPLGSTDIATKVRDGLAQLVEYLPDEATRHALLESRVMLLDLLGDAEGLDRVARMDSRAAGLRLKRAMVCLIEAIAARATVETNAPLLIVIEDAGDMDGPSWELIHHLLAHVRPRARMMMIVTYHGRSFVPAELGKYPGFGEIILDAFDMAEGEAQIDALLEANALGETLRFRLISAAKGSPLLLAQGLRQLVAEGLVGLRSDHWVELVAQPGEETIRDLGAIVAQRLEQASATARETAEVIAVIEDATGGNILEEVAARRAISNDELASALRQLADLGLIEVAGGFGDLHARTRHTLIHDEIYRQMPVERRRKIHEDAGEVYSRLPGAQSFPSLAADHLAQAGHPSRALHGLLAGVDRCVRSHNLLGATELCGQSLDLLKGLPREDQDRFLFHVLLRRERVLSLMGHREAQAGDLRKLEPLAIKVATEHERTHLAFRRARFAIQSGAHDDVEAQLLPPGTRPGPRSLFFLGVNEWQQGHRGESRALLEEAAGARPPEMTDRLLARILHARATLDAREGRMTEALHHFFEAWRATRRAGDVLGEALTTQQLGNLYWTWGRLMDADRLLRRAEKLLGEAGEIRARSRCLVQLGNLHASMGDFDEAFRCFGDVLQIGDRDGSRLDHVAAIIGQSRILVSRGNYENATSLVGQCLKELSRRPVRHPIQVDALVTMATTFAVAARGKQLVVGALNYANEAADKATEMTYLKGLVQALGIQVRALLALGRNAEAEAKLSDLDQAFASAVARDARLERLRAEVELYRHGVRKAKGDLAGAEQARQAAWNELMAQVRCLEGTGLERGFLANIVPHREILQAMEREEAGPTST